jgi:hypothetical protein
LDSWEYFRLLPTGNDIIAPLIKALRRQLLVADFAARVIVALVVLKPSINAAERALEAATRLFVVAVDPPSGLLMQTLERA